MPAHLLSRLPARLPQLPCFGYGKPVEALRARFRLELSDAQAAAYMKQLILGAYDKWTTGARGGWAGGAGGVAVARACAPAVTPQHCTVLVCTVHTHMLP